MFKLKLSPQQILPLFGAVNHKSFQNAKDEHWQEQDGSVNAQSVCWLYCWAETGLGSQAVAQQVESIFNQVFKDFGYNDFHNKVGLQLARKYRYRSGNIDAAVSQLLGI